MPRSHCSLTRLLLGVAAPASLLGCDLGFAVVDGSVPADAPGTDAAGHDASSEADAEVGADAGDAGAPEPCPRPWLLVVRRGGGGATAILRFHLDADAPPARCPDVTAGGDLDPDADAVVAVSGERLFVVGQRRQIVDVPSDSIVTDLGVPEVVDTLHTARAFLLEEPGDRRPIVGVVWTADYAEVRAYEADGTLHADWEASVGPTGPQGLGFATFPGDPTQVLALEAGAQLQRIDPFGDVLVDTFDLAPFTMGPSQVGTTTDRWAVASTEDLLIGAWGSAPTVARRANECGRANGVVPDPTRPSWVFVVCGTTAATLAHAEVTEGGGFEVIAGAGSGGSFSGLALSSAP